MRSVAKRVSSSEPIPDLRDERLMSRYASGDLSAFDALYARYESPIYGFCVRLLGDRDAAADAFQDTFITLVDTRSSYRPRGRFRSWLFTIARNACLDQLRRGQRQARLLELYRPSIDDSTPSMARSVESRDELARLLSPLSTEQREILLLHRYHGFSYAEIAHMTNSTESAVKQKAYRALMSLRGRRG